MSLDWSRDVDYGNLPQWLALGVGAVVAGFTIFGILTARRAYLDDVRVRKFAQARLVYAEVLNTYRFKTGSVSGKSLKRFHPEDWPLVMNFAEADPSLVITPSIRNRGQLWVDHDGRAEAQVVHVRVRNNSDELVSQVFVGISAKGQKGRSHFGGNMNEARILEPRGVIDFALALEGDVYSVEYVVVTFRDSSGKFWKRQNAEPVAESSEGAVFSEDF